VKALGVSVEGQAAWSGRPRGEGSLVKVAEVSAEDLVVLWNR
jgi:hypothetical protein